ncbi:MAG: hypothetical protein QM750_11965 [Rubrivivax sp.]
MRALHHVGAAAPGPVTPESDNARWQAGVIEGQEAEQSTQYAASAGATQDRALDARLTVLAAHLGIELRALDSDGWLLRHAGGASIGVVRGGDAVGAALAGFEAARNDVLALIARRAGRAA